MTDLAIVIVNYNTGDLLENCLRSIFQQIEGVNFKVVVVDNNSSDGSAARVREKFPQVELLENRENRGFAPANNQAIKSIQSQFVLLLNSDTLLLRNIAREMMDFIDCHPEAGALGCSALRPDGTVQPTSYNRPTLWLLFFHFLGLKHLVPPPGRARRLIAKLGGRLLGGNIRSYLEDIELSAPREVEVVGGACLFFRRSVLDSVGYFDENFFLGPDDYDWCLRLKKKGWKIFLLPPPGIIHYAGAATQKSELSLRYYEGLFYFYHKHHGKRAGFFLKAVLPPVLIAKAVLALASLPFSRREDRLERRSLPGQYLKLAKLSIESKLLPPRISGKPV